MCDVSLVLATWGRDKELISLLDSLSVQTMKNFELIVVDQNIDQRVSRIVDKYSHLLKIIYIKSTQKGLSYNRNVGLKHCRGEIIGFPDDDCYYEYDVLEKVSSFFQLNSESAFVAIKAVDPETNKVYKYKKNPVIYRKDILNACISFNMFFRNMRDVSFDERLGVGTYYSSGEETDYCYSFLKKGETGFFIKDTAVYHLLKNDYNNLERVYSYGLGFGALFKKEVLMRKNYEAIFLYAYCLLKVICAFIILPQKKYYINILRGRISGFISFEI